MSSGGDLHNILAVRLDNIGDVIMLSPALRELRGAYPDARITLMASPAGSLVAPLLPWVDEVIVYETVWQDASAAIPLDPARELRLVRDLGRQEFDAAFIFTSFSQSPYPPAYVCYLAGIPVRVGQSNEFAGTLLSHWYKPLPIETHQVDRNLYLLESYGIQPAGSRMELYAPAEAERRADRLLAERGIDAGAPFILLVPGASCAARRYEPARFAAVARELGTAVDLPIVVVGSGRERELVASIVETGGERAIPLVGETGIPELAAVIRRSQLVIANNSGPMHMADALDRPVVVLYAGTDYESQWRPRFAPSRLLRQPTDCSPCYAFQCPLHMECLDIPPHAVVEAACELLEKAREEAIT